MNPLGLRPAQVLAARSGRTQWVKTPPISLFDRPADQTQLMIAGMFSVMRNLRRSPGQDMCVQCNMNFFSSSRKIFAPV
jgi:hypothetical protein